jgi:hypothetical protein
MSEGLEGKVGAAMHAEEGGMGIMNDTVYVCMYPSRYV